LNNIVEHAYDRDDGQIELRLQWLPGRLVCELLDAGLPMPDCTLPEGRAQSVADDQALPEGGFGWFLIRQLTEKLLYQRIGARNHLSFQLNVEQ
jgi:serine/threonine-protein kinase RsbW